jgi:hypothetical protein
MEERVYVESLDSDVKNYVPDVHVFELPRRGANAGGTGGVATAEPIIVHVPAEVTERYIQIIDVRSGGRVVTVIELLSPSNKLPGKGRNEYLAKQQHYVDAGVNLVEIDLLRVGQHTTLAKLALVPSDLITTFHVNIFRATRGDRLEYFPVALRERLPRLPIPLRRSDPDAVLDLQAVADLAYERGRYDDIDYSRPLQPPLHPADLEWASALLAARRQA